MSDMLGIAKVGLRVTRMGWNAWDQGNFYSAGADIVCTKAASNPYHDQGDYRPQLS